MRRLQPPLLTLLPVTVLPWITTAIQNISSSSNLQYGFSAFDDNRPPGCPPCFNCNLDDFQCHQFAHCSKANGKCVCPPGYGGDDCTQPLCGSLAEKERQPRKQDQKSCECNSGWEGINCNVCKTNNACSNFMPEGKDGVCYREGLVQQENFQMCDITNRKILDQLDPKIPQATFSCNAKDETCNFQFWVDEIESFYCDLNQCSSNFKPEPDRNITNYACEKLKCRCIPGRMLCGQDGSIDIGEFLEGKIKGPATFTTISTEGGSSEDGSVFSEPHMNKLISQVFGDRAITLKCHSGECLYKTDVPGYAKPVKKINTPLIAGVIAGCALFVVAVILLVWYLSRRAASQKNGLIHLPEDDDEAAKLIADHKPTSFHFQNVSYNLKGKQILYDVQGAVRPGELMAIMGASGAGKTTFLDILARKNKRGESQGSFFVNGEKIADDDFRNVVGFVDQEDTMLPTLTVHETILDSALLRLPKDMSFMSKEQRVEDVEKELGIYHIRDHIIGSEEGSGRGISGGEKRRVGIACELVTSPSILFLDEPTSGLDAYNAYNVVECLVNLAKIYNRTVVLTIHQPRSNIVALFDQLILLAQGRTVYSGPFSSCQSYFDSLGYACPPGFNIADYLVDLTMHAGILRSPMDRIVAEARNNVQTRTGSVMAVKSIPSISNNDSGRSDLESPNIASFLRPKGARRTSVREQQERELYTRKKSNGVDRPITTRNEEINSVDNSLNGSQTWFKLAKQSGAPPPQILDDSHQLSLENNTTGTDLDTLVNSYTNSDVAASLHKDIKDTTMSANAANGISNPINGHQSNGGIRTGRVKGYRKVGLFGQFSILSIRTWRNLYRNPMLMLTHYAIAILLAVFLGFLFYGLSDDIAGFQNRLGLFFFVLALFGFGSLTSLTVFATERLLFVRERAKGYYMPISYFAAKVIFDIIPLRLIPPIILGAVVYPMTGLIPAWPEFLKFILFLILFNFAAATISLFIGIVFQNGGVANLIGSLVMLFSLLFSGSLLNHETIPKAVLWLQKLSIFHFAFEGLIVNEVKYLSLTDHKYGIDIEVPGSAILSSFGFDVQALWMDCVGLALFGAVFVVLGYLAIHFVLVERR